jgi:quinol monooxygenase YgiN
MPIFQTAHYVIRPEGVDAVKEAIIEFVGYVAANEPGSHLYTSWQQADDPTRFVHLFIFDDEAAQQVHGQSAAVRKFESVYRPHLAEGPVRFTDYVEIATNQPR